MKMIYVVLSCSVFILVTGGRAPSSFAPSPKCPLKDIVFVLDMSSSVGKDNFQIMLDKCKEIVDDHTVGSFATLFGLDVFSTKSKTIIKLKDHTDKESMKEAIDDVDYEGGLTKTYLALNRLISRSFSFSFGHRPRARKIAIVMTDGRSQQKMRTVNAAKKARKAGIKLIAIGIGDNIDWEEIIAISSGGGSSGARGSSGSAFRVSSFSALRRFNIDKLSIPRC